MGTLGLEVVRVVKSRWLSLCCASVLVAAVTFLMLHVLSPAQWEVAGVVRIGQSPDLLNTTLPRLLMSPEEAEQLLRGEVPADLGSVRLRKVSETMLELRVVASASDRANVVFSEIFDSLKSRHDAIFDERIGTLRAYAGDLSNVIDAGQQMRRQADAACDYSATGSSDTRLLCGVMLLSQSARLESDFRLGTDLARLEEKLQPSWSYPTALVAPASAHLVAKSLLANLLLAAFAGLATFVLLGIGLAMRRLMVRLS
jgi:hypothetical protein